MKTPSRFARGLLGLALVSLQPLLANGGGYSFGIESTGHIQAFEAKNLEHVVMAEETLDIELLPTEAIVKVRYLLRNEGGAQEVRFGFPVEEVAPYFEIREVGAPKLQNLPEGFQAYEARVEGELLEVEWKAETSDPAEKNKQLKGLAGWMVSEFRFPKKSERVLEISYRVAHSGRNTFVSNDSTESETLFHYRFSTGAIWKGPIGKGLVSINLGEGLNGTFTEIKKPLERFKKTKTGWVWGFESFEPTLADDLMIQVAPSFHQRTNLIEDSDSVEVYYEREGIWGLRNTDYEVTASSELTPEREFSYQASNVKTFGLAGHDCWAEGVKGSGSGFGLPGELRQARPLAAM